MSPIWDEQFADNFKVVTFSQPWKASSPISVTLSGIIISVKLEQFLKAYIPIFVRVFEKLIEVKFVQSLNASPLTIVIVSGMVKEVMFSPSKEE